MLEAYKNTLGGDSGDQVAAIEAKYVIDLAELESIRDKARNDFFKLPKNTRETSEEGMTQKNLYLVAAYNIALIEYQRDLEVATISVAQYTRSKTIRLANL